MSIRAKSPIGPAKALSGPPHERELVVGPKPCPGSSRPQAASHGRRARRLMTDRSTSQPKKVLRVASVRFALIGAPPSTMPSRSSITSRRSISRTRRAPHCGKTYSTKPALDFDYALRPEFWPDVPGEEQLHLDRYEVALRRRDLDCAAIFALLGAGIAAGRDRLERLTRPLPRLGEAEDRVASQGQLARPVGMSVADGPALDAAWLHNEVEARQSRIRDLEALARIWLDAKNALRGQDRRHVITPG